MDSRSLQGTGDPAKLDAPDPEGAVRWVSTAAPRKRPNMSTARNPAVEELRSYLGEERFRRFVAQVTELAGGERLHYWHSQVLDEFEPRHGAPLPRSPEDLARLFAAATPEPPCLSEADTPAWAYIEFLDTQCPVQAEGWCYVGADESCPDAATWNFYFRARGEHWSVSASDSSDPADVLVNDDHSYYYEEPYEARVGAYDAGSMTQDVARYYLVRELKKLRSRSRGR